MRAIIIVVPLLMLLAAGCNSTLAQVDLTSSEFESKMNVKNVQLVDVRTPEEFNQEHIKGALNIDYYDKSFSEKVNQLDKSKPVLLYCRSGRRSAQSAQILKEAGFKEIYNLQGGIINFENKKLLVVR